jgi:hypothetical protein
LCERDPAGGFLYPASLSHLPGQNTRSGLFPLSGETGETDKFGTDVDLGWHGSSPCWGNWE